MNGQCETCGRGCDYRDSYCDSCWEEISCEDTPQEYIPTDQDLEDMRVAFSTPYDVDKYYEKMLRESELDNPF